MPGTRLTSCYRLVSEGLGSLDLTLVFILSLQMLGERHKTKCLRFKQGKPPLKIQSDDVMQTQCDACVFDFSYFNLEKMWG